MKRIVRIFVCIVFLAGTIFSPVYAGSLPEPQPACIYCGARLPYGHHAPSCPYYRAQTKQAAPVHKSSSHKASSNASINNMIVGTIFQSLLTSLFVGNTSKTNADLAAKQRAAALAAIEAQKIKRAQALAAQAAYEKMMRSYKKIGNSDSLAFKSLSGSADLQIKGLDGDMESLEANARKPFDTAGELGVDSVNPGTPTPFFGDKMPVADIKTLVDPDNAPNVVDLREAKKFVVENIKKDSKKLAVATKPKPQPKSQKPQDKPKATLPSCEKVRIKLAGFIAQRAKFKKTIDFSQSQLDIWKSANRNALLNAAKDGIEYFTGEILEGLTKRAKAADRLAAIYEKNSAEMAKKGIDIAKIKEKIDRLRLLSSVGQVSKITADISDWQGFLKHGLSSLLNTLTSSNEEIQQMMNDPKLSEYFKDAAPELNTLLDISKIAAASKVFGKWVAKKLSIIGAIELSIKQSYNALDWFLSYKRILEANKINGNVLQTARGIQLNIDNAYMELGNCSN
jgi:hypothetical protein